MINACSGVVSVVEVQKQVGEASTAARDFVASRHRTVTVAARATDLGSESDDAA